MIAFRFGTGFGFGVSQRKERGDDPSVESAASLYHFIVCVRCICVTDELLTPGTHLREESKNQGGHRSITWELGSEHNDHVEGKRVGFVARFGSVSDSGNHEAAFLVHSPHHLFLILESKHIYPPMS